MPLPYLTKTPPLGGQLKRRIEDFVVEEILTDGTVCGIEQLNQIPPARIPCSVPENPNPRKFDQLHVRMEKFNIETTFAIRNLTRGVGTSVKRVGYAGLKDKRALTCQRISIWQPDVERVRKFMMKGMAFHHAEWSDKRIELGDARGNKFRIVIRDIPLSAEDAEKRIREFATQLGNGIPNYYGEQRFGGHRQITHVVGRLLLEDKVEEAVMTYLTKDTEGEEEDARAARKNLLETQDFGRALKEYPDKFHFERAMLNHLNVKPGDFEGAFMQLPAQSRYLFTHAYQSHVFNEIVGERVKRGMMYAMQGDVLENGVPTAPLPGTKTKFAEGLAGDIERGVMEREKITPKFFANIGIGELSSWGARKPILLRVHEFRLESVGADEWYEGKSKASVGFWLDKGAYATTALRELMKTE